MKRLHIPVLQDFLQDDRRHCAMDASFPHSWRTQTLIVMHRWSTYRHHPTHSLLWDLKQLVACSGSHWKWWKNSALLLLLLREIHREKEEIKMNIKSVLLFFCSSVLEFVLFYYYYSGNCFWKSLYVSHFCCCPKCIWIFFI